MCHMVHLVAKINLRLMALWSVRVKVTYLWILILANFSKFEEILNSQLLLFLMNIINVMVLKFIPVKSPYGIM